MSYEVTKNRVVQWIGIILIIGLFAGAYWYFQVRASTLNASKNDLVTNGLVGLWSFNGDDISGTTAYDRSGSGNNGTLTNSPTKVDGKIGQALNFDGVDDRVTIAADVIGTGAASICTWIYPRSVGENSYGRIVSSSVERTIFLVDTSSRLAFTSDTTTIIYSPIITFNHWIHVCATRDAAGAGIIYMDGVPVVSGATGTPLSNGTTYIGNSGGDRTFDGLIDEVRIYNRVITVTEIQSLYTQGNSSKSNSAVSQPQGTGRLDSGLAGYWKLDDGSGTSATDSSTNGNTGTLTGAGGLPTWTTGQISGAVTFDGVDDYITAPSITAYNTTGNFSTSVWIHPPNQNQLSSIIVRRRAGSPFEQWTMGIGDTNCNGGGSGKKIQMALLESYPTIFRCLYTTNDVVDGNWHHLVLVSNRTSATTTMYVDGISVPLTVGVSNGAYPNPDVAMPIVIGQNNGGSNYYTGDIDEARYYNRALSADEVGQLYRLNAPTGVDTGLKGYWSFNGQDMSGTTAYDRSGAGNTGTLVSGPTKKPGKLGQALNFDGSNDYVTVPNSAALNPTSQITVSAWIKRGNNGTRQFFISKGNATSVSSNQYWLEITAANLIVFLMSNGTTSYTVTSPSALTDTNGWHLITGAWDGTTQRLYIDGVEVISGAASLTLNTTTDELALGNRSQFRNIPFNGILDEPRVYSRALTAGEIKGLYDTGESDKVNSSVSQLQGTGRLDSGLAGYWKLDDGSGTSATDSSTNANTGTLTSGPTWTTGQINSAVNFDGTDDYVDLGTSKTYISTTAPFTVSLWLNLDIFNGSDHIPFSFKTDSATAWTGILNSNASYSDFTFGKDTSSAKRFSFPGGVTTGVWRHVTITYNGSGINTTGNYSAYVDGVSVAVSSSGALVGINNESYLGRIRSGGSPIGYWDGKLDEVRVYNRALLADEIAQLYRLNAPTGVDTGLKGYWSFNGQDMNGTTAYDRSGAGNSGTLTNGPTKVPGKLGQALSFDGTDDYLSVADNTSLDFTTSADFTLTGWLYRATSTTDDTILAKRNGIANTDDGYIAYIDDVNDRLHFEVSDNADTDEFELVSNSTFTTPGWNHVAIVWDDDSLANTEIYINGTADSATETGTIGNIDDLSNALTFRAGAESDNGNPFDGKVDEVRVYNRALASTEIQAQYNGGGRIPWICGNGTVTDADSNIYGTIQVGTQCWMRQNMRVGTRISGSTSQTNNATTEKYCYSNSDANCTGNNPNQPDGGLYQWNEAMQYSTTAGARGICPSGWHIPTDTEQYTLENYLKDVGETCSASRSGSYDCSSAGTKLKPSGTSSFEGNLAGLAVSGSFFNRASNGFFWSSSESGANAWYRILYSSVATVNRGAGGKTYGFSVRCLQDSP